MDISVLKETILENNYVPVILDEIGCHHISCKAGYVQCGNPDGDNQGAITVYLNEGLLTVDYTREIHSSSGLDTIDIFDLVQFFCSCTFYEAVRKVCNWCGIDYYKDEYNDLSESLKFTKFISEMADDESNYEEMQPLKPIKENVLSYYFPAVNDCFLKDNISYDTQMLFEIGYDDVSNRITIPVRDEMGTLVGVKGRLFLKQEEMTEEEQRVKYIYLERCNRARILYGLYLSEKYIARTGYVYVVEAEKGVMQLWNMGIKNCVATCGKKISQYQINMLTRLSSHIIFCFDKDVTIDELNDIADKFLDCIQISAIVDTDNLLEEKESPTDNPDKFKQLIAKYTQVIKNGK